MRKLKSFFLKRLAVFLVLAMLVTMLPAAPYAAAAEYPVLQPNTQTTVDVEAGTITYLAFVPEVTERYEFHSIPGTSTGGYDTYGYLYDAYFNLLSSNDDGFGDGQFQIKYTLEAGKTYYLGVKYYFSSDSGSFDVMASAIHSYSESIAKEATCSEEGTKLFSCIYCDAGYTEPYTLDHQYADGRCIYCGMTLSTGGNVNDTVTWSLEGTVLRIGGTGEMVYDDYQMPWRPYADSIRSVIVEEGVTTICGSAFEDLAKLEECSIADSVTSIGDYAFWRCMNLTEIDFPANLEYIGEYAFSECEKLAQIDLPAKLKTIGNGAFFRCIALREISIPDSCTTIGDYAFANCEKLAQIDLPANLEIIGGGAFSECVALREILIPDSCTTIGEWAFSRCVSLTRIHIPESLESIGPNAFEGCSNLRELTVDPNNPVFSMENGILYQDVERALIYCLNDVAGTVTVRQGTETIQAGAFRDCTQLQAVEIPDSVTTIGYGAFFGCSSLKSIEIPDSVTALDGGVFTNCTALETAVLPDTLTTLPYSLFNNCSALKNFTIPASVTQIDNHVFYGCAALEKIDLPESITSLNSNLFSGCSALKNITIPGNVTYIAENVFENCTSLKEVVIPESVTYLGYFAFTGCSALEKVVLSGKITELNCDVFKGCTSLANIAIPAAVEYIYDGAFADCASLTKITLPAGIAYVAPNAFAGCACLTELRIQGENPNYFVQNGILYSSEPLQLVCCPGGLNGKVTVLENTQSIGDFAFFGCGKVTEIELPESVVSIGRQAFQGCASLTAFRVHADNPNYQAHAGILYDATSADTLRLICCPGGMEGHVTVRENTESIDEYAFFGCSKVTGIDLPYSVREIGAEAFACCTGLTEVELPQQLETLDWYAFMNCSGLEEIVIPANVSHLSNNAHFIYREPLNCASLQGVTFQGDAPQLEWSVFENDAFTAYYPAGNTTWTSEVKEQANGDVTWLTYGDADLVAEGSYEDSLWDLKTDGTLSISGTGMVRKGWNSYWDAIGSVNVAAEITGIGAYTFTGISPDASVHFRGNAPAFEADAFATAVVTAYYPEDDTTWTEAVRQGYGGDVTWVGEFVPREIATGWSGTTQWSLISDGTLIITGNGNMKNYGYNGGQPWLNKGVDVKRVVIEEGVKSVGSGAFRNLTTLKSVKFPATTLTKMGEAAFYGSGLTSVEIPASLWTIQPYTFKNCANLTSVKFHEGNLQKISDGSFYGTGLTKLVLPDCLAILDIYAFKGCSKLTDITIGSGLTELREAVFYGTAIPTITIPEGITKIGPYAFKNCVKLETVDFPSTLTSVGEASFYANTALKAVDLPAKVTTIGNYAFRKCAAIETLNLSTELVTVGECAFYGCTGITTLVIPDKVTTIKPYAFKTCTGLTSVTLGKKVATIGEGAFNTCTGLKTIVFPASLKEIGPYCFSGSYNIWKMTFLGDGPAIGTGAFKGLTATAYYPGGNLTWTAEILQNYGGKITWKNP